MSHLSLSMADGSLGDSHPSNIASSPISSPTTAVTPLPDTQFSAGDKLRAYFTLIAAMILWGIMYVPAKNEDPRHDGMVFQFYMGCGIVAAGFVLTLGYVVFVSFVLQGEREDVIQFYHVVRPGEEGRRRRLFFGGGVGAPGGGG